MPLNIKDPETDRLARQLAELTGENITDAVRKAVAGRLEQERRRRGKKIDRAALRRIQKAIADIPVVDDRNPDDLLGYDESGLPR